MVEMKMLIQKRVCQDLATVCEKQEGVEGSLKFGPWTLVSQRKSHVEG